MRSKPYCNAPWLGLKYEGTRGCAPCCEWKGESFFGTYTDYIKSDYLNKFKDLMHQDKMHFNCRECTHNETVGNHSRRLYFLEYECCEDNTIDYRKEGLNKIVRLDYRAGNKCNMKCRMCGPESSSLLEEEIIAAGEQKEDFVRRLDTSDVYDIDLSQCEEISILGGEPSIDLKIRKFMNYVADNYPKIKCIITTNGTNASDKWFKTLMKFCEGAGLQIILSIDATGEVQDFQRSGGKWNKIKKNALRYKEISDSVKHEKCSLSIQLTASTINMTVLDTWWDELLSIGIKVNLNQVQYPPGMSIEAIPDENKKEQIKWLKKWIKNLPTPSEFTRDWPLRNKYDSAETAIRILENTKYTSVAATTFKLVQSRYDKLRSEDITKLDERFKVMMS